MPRDPVQHAVELICRYRACGHGSAELSKSLYGHFEMASRCCRMVYGDICARCPDCACATRALEQAYLEVPASPRGAQRVAEKPPIEPSPPDFDPPRKRPAMVMPRPQPPVRTVAVAKVA